MATVDSPGCTLTAETCTIAPVAALAPLAYIAAGQSQPITAAETSA